MTTAAIRPKIGPDDRLGLTMFVAVIVHTMVVLGVSFAPEPIPEARFEALEIILVPEKSDRPPDDADMLAQANLQGGGDAEKSDPPAAPVKAPIPAQNAEIASSPAPAVKAVPAPMPTIAEPAPQAETSPAPPAAGLAQVHKRLVEEVTQADLAVADKRREAKVESSAVEQPDAEPLTPQKPIDSPPLPTAAQLLTRSFALASLNAELQQRLDSKAKRPRRKYISANTREYRYAAYMEAWRAKVERVGNINYPNAARERRLSGNLLLDVALSSDGAVKEITVRRSSGHKVLDDAAIRIVELASPFAPFPDEVLEEVDVLHITRTWKFVNNQDFKAN
jgi:periplasmic protein TonB